MSRPRPVPPWFVLSIFAGNCVQLGGLLGSLALVQRARRAEPPWSGRLLVLSWAVNYFCNHAIAHWAVGRLVGLRFVGYGVHGTTSPDWYPPGIGWIFAHVPFFSARTDSTSLRRAQPAARLIMYLAGSLSTVINGLAIPLYGQVAGIPRSRVLLAGAMLWFTPMLIVESLRAGGDLRRAGRELRYIGGDRIQR